MTNATSTPTVRRLERGDGPIGGVAAGMADYFDVDPTLIRLGLVAGTLIGGPVIPICYLAAWIIIPRSDVPVAPPIGTAPTPPPPPTATTQATDTVVTDDTVATDTVMTDDTDTVVSDDTGTDAETDGAETDEVTS